jgi:SpoVK/Ycf46/Vps4 family AAA+-type ATPase
MSCIATCALNTPKTKRLRVPSKKYSKEDFDLSDTPTTSGPPSDDVPHPKRTRLTKAAETPTATPDVIPFEGKIDTLEDLINLSKDRTNYTNIDMKSLRRIRPYLEELRDMVGLKSLKETVMAQVIYYLQGLHKDSEDYMHTCIYGGPGTGKTTVAELLGLIFSNIGVLKQKKFITAQREDLVAGYLGQTAMKTALVLAAAQGGVLFIDEIYSLGSKDGRDSFAKEAIDTINLYLSENKGDFMLIIGGYEKEVNECFFNQNPGLRRRFMWYHNITPYTHDELSDIFYTKVGEIGWSVGECADRAWVSGIIKANKQHFKDMGGSVENFITLIKVQHSKRVFGKDPSLKKIITKEDIQNAINKMNQDKKPSDDPSPPPPMMYL